MTILSAWRDDAACLGHAPLWDATIGDGGRWDGEETKDRRERFDLAIRVCESCPVSQQCAAEVVIGRDEGVRGGVLLPPLETVRVRQGRAQVGKCGTPYGARAHRARGEDVCTPCAEARRQYDRDYQRRRRTA